ncbi:MAG: cytochrome c oxidase subunit II [Acidobacteriia bacterium]|nr:cytochrome c oxidase subunit II [Terriglobia bacterium]
MAPWLRPHSPQTQAIVTLFDQYLAVAAVIFVIVTALVSYSIVRYRARGLSDDPPEFTASRRWELAWTAIPLVIVTVFFALALRTMAFVDAPQDGGRNADLTIIGHQWWWEARYPAPAGGLATTANDIHIPTGRRLLARVEAVDVIHDFWVPQLARKIDAIPGRASYVWLEADAPGIYQGTCSEFCGMQHAGMRFQVIAEPEAAFTAWLDREAAAPPAPQGLAIEGQRLFRERKCGDCHSVSPADRRALIGPPLAHIASRNRLAGDRAVTPENLRLWIIAPQALKPGNRMPDQKLPATEVDALTAYLQGLQ